MGNWGEKCTERGRKPLGQAQLDGIVGDEGEAVQHELDAGEDDCRIGVVQTRADTLHNDLSLIGVTRSVQ
jgi:hypothetical protein